MIGTKLAQFTVTAHLGSGGFGDVYQATDSKLGRSVAIKLLPEVFARDADRVARFEREARVLASLNHPNIAVLYGMEEAGGRKFLVMELVPGDTLAERIKRGPIPVNEALEIAKQILEALEAAHESEKPIVHRDLKPANVKITPDGKVKVLDFGLAKAYAPDFGSDDLSNAPTLSMAPTVQGMIMGTPAYMSPEQAKGLPVDRRTDIFAFGALLYEMLSGHQAFGGNDVGSILARVIEREPDWGKLPPKLAPQIHELLRRCLEKDPKKRRRDAGELRINLEQALTEPVVAATAVSTPTRGLRMGWIAFAAAVLVAMALGVPTLRHLQETPRSQPVMRFAAELGADARLAYFTSGVAALGISSGPAAFLSPDGRTLVFAGAESISDTSKTQLYVRPLDQLKASPLAGTEGARNAFFSPDGQWLAFFANGKLKKVSITGGAAVTLCDATDDRGGTWADDGSIIFAPSPTAGLFRVSSSGGTPEPFTKLDPPENTHRWPYVVRGGQAVLFTANNASNFEDANIVVQSLRTGERKIVQRGGYQPGYSTSGHLVYIHDGTLLPRLSVWTGWN